MKNNNQIENLFPNNDWYVDNIEEPVREIVYNMRNAGINTTCSCGHYLWIQGDTSKLIDDMLESINTILCRLNLKTYKVRIFDDVIDGYKHTWFELSLPDKKGNYHFQTIDNLDFVKCNFDE